MASIEATDATSLPLPPLATAAARFDEHGTPERVLYADGAAPLPERLAHGEVLVRMLAAPVGEDDLNRVATPLAVLNDFPPFNRTANKWEPTALPATGGGEGVGIVIATAKNVPTLHRLPARGEGLGERSSRRPPRPARHVVARASSPTLRLLKVDPSDARRDRPRLRPRDGLPPPRRLRLAAPRRRDHPERRRAAHASGGDPAPQACSEIGR